MNEESIFAEAIAIDSTEKREQFLDSACGDNLELRQAVQKLLTLSDSAGSFLEHPVLEGTPDFDGVKPITVCGNRFTPDAGSEGALAGAAKLPSATSNRRLVRTHLACWAITKF